MQSVDSSVLLRKRLKAMLGIPRQSCPLQPEYRGCYSSDGVAVERWIWTSEPGSRVTSLLYRPEHHDGMLPGLIITNGHGESKNCLSAQYAGQLYAKMGIVCLVHDTIGEEERHLRGEMGTRAHDQQGAIHQVDQAGRLMMGKMVYDAMRGIDFLLSQAYVDPQRIGAAGNSLGGTVAGWLAALDPRLKLAVVSGCGYAAPGGNVVGKPCWSVPEQRMLNICSYSDFLSLAAPHCALLVMNGDQDDIVTLGRAGYWNAFLEHAKQCADRYDQADAGDRFRTWFQPGGGHRSYHLHKDAIAWVALHFQLVGWSPEQVDRLPTVAMEHWLARHGLEFPARERDLYWTPLHNQGSVYADLQINPFPPNQLNCLQLSEIGEEQYTLEGWIENIGKIPGTFPCFG